MFLCVPPPDPTQYIFHTPMTRYSLSLNTNKTKKQLKGSVKEPNKFHIYETEKITCKASDAAEYIELFGSVSRDRHARCILMLFSERPPIYMRRCA